MKNVGVFGAGFLAGLGVWVLASATSVAAPDEAALKAEILGLRTEVELTKKSLDDQSKTIEGIQEYIAKQGEAAGKLAGVLKSSEQAGFTAGINPNSRELLLDGWHMSLKAAQDVPKSEAEKPAPDEKLGRRLFK